MTMTTQNPFDFAPRQDPARATTLPARPVAVPKEIRPTIPRSAESGADFFADDDDEEALALRKAKGDNALPQTVHEAGDPTLHAIQESFKELREKYPTGGIKSSRFITARILINAPAGYFDRYEEDIKKTVNWVQSTLADRERSDSIGAAQAEPTNDALQDDAYRNVHAVALEYMETLSYRGIEKQIVIFFVCNEIVGFGRLDPLWRDRSIDEILCNGPKDVQVEIGGQLLRVPGCTFRDPQHLLTLLERLYGAIGKSLTRMTPLVKGRLHDKSRMFAVHTSVAPAGPNFSIRRHPERIWTPAALVDRGSASAELMTYIGNLIHKGCSFVIIGGTSTGKTSFLNAMTGFYRNDVRILTLEDNLEMKPHPRKLIAAAMECQPPSPDKPNDKGVTMRDLVKSSLQLRPDGIIVGEVTDGAAYDLAQALNTGHFGASTIHANSAFEGIYRISSLIAQGELVTAEGALPLIAAAFDVIIHVEHFPMDGSRRVVSVSEVAPYAEKNEHGEMKLPLNPLWRFREDGLQNGKIIGGWEQVGEMSPLRRERRHLDLERNLTWDELQALSYIDPGAAH